MTPRAGGPTPWGEAQYVEPVGEGIMFAGTAGHGGYWVPREQLSAIPAAERAYAKGWSQSEQWYEEDCCALSVVLAFPHLFPDVTDEQRAEYRAMLDHYMRPEPVRLTRASGYVAPEFNPTDCGGAFDGFTVRSDADGGL